MHIQYKSTGEGHSIHTVLQRYLLDSLHRLHCLGVAVLQCMNSVIFPVSFPSYQRCSKHDFAVEMWIAGSRDHEEGHLVLLDCQSPCYFPAYSFQATSQIQLLVEWKWWSSFHDAPIFFTFKEMGFNWGISWVIQARGILQSAVFGKHANNQEKRTSKNRMLIARSMHNK